MSLLIEDVKAIVTPQDRPRVVLVGDDDAAVQLSVSPDLTMVLDYDDAEGWLSEALDAVRVAKGNVAAA